MVLLNCSIVGEGAVIPVVIEESITVGLLKEAIAAKLSEKRADRLQLFLAKTAVGTWLDWGGAAAVTLDGNGKLQGFEEMNPTLFLKNKKIFGDFQLGEGQVHVLVVPPKATATNLATEELPVVKRARTEVTFACDELVAITAIAQKLNPATDLAVGKLLKGPFSVLGTNLFGGLYVRQEYWDLYKLIKQQIQEAGTRKKLRRVLVIGSPGIGKSVFGVFLLLLFLTEKKDVAYRSLGKSSAYYFNWNSANGYEISQSPLPGKKYEGLFDGDEAGGALDFGTFVHAYVLASPSTKNYNDFAKEACFKVCMNPWTKAECQQLASSFRWGDEDEWLRRYNLVGGIPRFLFSSLITFDDLVRRVNADIPHKIKDLKRLIILFQQEVFDDRMKHSLFHFYRFDDAPSRTFLSFSSLAVEAIVNTRCYTGTAELRQVIRSMWQSPEPILRSWRGKERERCLLQDLRTSKLCMKSLEEDGGRITQLGDFIAGSMVIQALSKMKNELVLYIPLLKTFPAIDAVLVLPREEMENHEGRIIYVQATVAEPIPIQYQRLKDLYRGLASRNEFAGYTHMLLFMVSDDIYDRFTFQPYKDGDKTTHEKENDFMVTQYVGKTTQ